jgi:hypothetical protein
VKRTLYFGIVGALLAAMPVPGHHSITTYDLVHGTILNGVATGFDWENPHARLYLDVTAEDTIEHWGIELESPNLLRRLGWDKQTIKPGDRIIATGGRARNASFNLRAASIELPDGRKLRALQ